MSAIMALTGSLVRSADQLTLTCVPSNCIDIDVKVDPADATATVIVSANKSVSWTFVKISGVTASTGATSGTSTNISITRTTIGTDNSVYDVTANGAITKRVTLTAQVINI